MCGELLPHDSACGTRTRRRSPITRDFPSRFGCGEAKSPRDGFSGLATQAPLANRRASSCHDGPENAKTPGALHFCGILRRRERLWGGRSTPFWERQRLTACETPDSGALCRPLAMFRSPVSTQNASFLEQRAVFPARSPSSTPFGGFGLLPQALLLLGREILDSATLRPGLPLHVRPARTELRASGA